jgi:hypothetical protein
VTLVPRPAAILPRLAAALAALACAAGLLAAPDARADALSAVTGPASQAMDGGRPSMHLTGTVTTPAGAPTSTAAFDWGPTTAYGRTTDPAMPDDVLTYGSEIYAGRTNVGVSRDLIDDGGLATDLEPGTTYHYRAKVFNAHGTAYGADATFTTPGIAPSPPLATTAAATQVGAGFFGRPGAVMNGTVDPRGTHGGSWYFEFGTTTAYGERLGESTFSAGLSAPFAVSAQAADEQRLKTDTTYHYRLVAVNAFGTDPGVDQTFAIVSPFRVRATGADAVGRSGAFRIAVACTRRPCSGTITLRGAGDVLPGTGSRTRSPKIVRITLHAVRSFAVGAAKTASVLFTPTAAQRAFFRKAYARNGMPEVAFVIRAHDAAGKHFTYLGQEPVVYYPRGSPASAASSSRAARSPSSSERSV